MQEYLYHVDSKDNVLGKIERNLAHQNKLLHRAGIVLVFNSKGELFLTNRSPEKKIFPNCVDTACSFHVKYGQTYEEAAAQELLEETRIKATPQYLKTFLQDEDPDHMMVAMFKLIHDGKIELDPAEATSGEFYTLEEAKKLVKKKKPTHWLRKALELI